MLEDNHLTQPHNWLSNLLRFLGARFLGHISYQMQSVAVGWQVYAITKNPLDLGIIGLVQFLPIIGFSLIAGHTADQFNRKSISLIGLFVSMLCAFALYWRDRAGLNSVGVIYAILFAHATMRAFSGPANQSILPDLAPHSQFSKVVAWNSSSWQVAMTLGPTLGGLIYGWTGTAQTVYFCSTVCLLIAFFLQLSLKVTANFHKVPATLETFFAGLTFVWKKKILFGAISLDLFAVLFGGSVALLPAFASDILHTGPTGLGILRSAPGIGAALTAALLAVRPIHQKAGYKMFLAVTVFGLATLGFALSTNFILSFIFLFITGSSDVISVVIRGTLVQLQTPQNMRGRVSAVNLIFISASNELGEFESGITAAWLGVVPSVLAGGLGTILVAFLWSRFFPSLRKLNHLVVDGN